jgi:hypothetical protein
VWPISFPFCNPMGGPQIDDWMEEFDAEQERKARERQAAMGEDGWTVVVRAKVGLGAELAGGASCRMRPDA